MTTPKDDSPLNAWMAPMLGMTEQWLAMQQGFMEDFQRVFTQAASGSLPALSDRRFSSEAWQKNPQLLSLAHLYLLSSQKLSEMVEHLDMDQESKDKFIFAMQQWIDAVAPSNFFALNADALAAFEQTQGESLQKGLYNLLQDLQKGRITQTDETAFDVGKNLATTPGKVVYKNAFFELIQYAPQTTNVYEIPLLIVPPCINKFYILDLQKENSFVQGAVAQGHTVYLMSWRNPLPNDVDQPEKYTWDDYIEHGIIRALQAVTDISQQDKVNTLGFCVGGTMLATGLAVAKARGLDYANSMTLLTTFLDFEDTGVMHVFVDEASVALREQTIGQGGLMPAKDLAATFSFLRPNELVWNYVVSNYFKGETPVPFDILYWNADSTNLPGPFYAWYLRHTYLENNLKKPAYLTVAGEALDLSLLDTDTYLYASKDDHIVPWKSSYLSNDILTGDVRFCLGASGHVAGVVNPPVKKKRHYWVNEYEYDDGYLSAEQWFEDSERHEGSWWVDWYAWIAERAGKQVRAKKTLGNRQYKPTVEAPGSYAKVRAVQ
ncbi:MAG: class I poly(R)-hydroxyalkanoic acid synthase [Pelistega sp.]|nr:class I poly(R)-hydroxyalkanoic acid synthase [Pelistega sp.]